MAATLQRKSFGGIIFVIITKKITIIIVSGNHFVIILARMVVGMTSAIKRHNISCTLGSTCRFSDLVLDVMFCGRYKSMQKSAFHR